MESYVAFLADEHRAALIERELRNEPSAFRQERIASGLVPMLWLPERVPAAHAST